MRLALLLVPLLALAAADTPTLQIKVDQAGYLPNAPKIAMVTAQAERFVVKRVADNKPVLEGKLAAAAVDADSGDRIQTADFSGLKKAGAYYLEVPGVGRSWPFSIGPGVYSRAYYLAMRAFYGQRCGTAVDLGPEFPGYSYPACHLKALFHPSSGRQGPSRNKGGWHDAGDYGRYVVNSGITTGTLLWTWEMFGGKVKGISLKIPESGRKTPDILSEIRWNLEWMLSMQDEDGGVWHKQTSQRFCGMIMPDKDDQPSEIIGTGQAPFKSTCATADLAAVAAIAARVYEPYDSQFAARCLRAARQGFAWTERYPNVTYLSNPPGVFTGGYGDKNCGDERLWAAAELWRTTGDAAYHRYFLDHYQEFRESLRAPDKETWLALAPFAWWTYAMARRKDADPKATADIRETSLTFARQIAERTRKNGYQVSLLAQDYFWGSNGLVGNYAVQLLATNAIAPDPSLVEAANDNLHYLLGRNTFSLSWVTRLGANPYRHPHHRPSAGDQNAEPWPGLLSGGPNAARQDALLAKLPAGLPPAKVYVDEEGSFASNEIAINWQAALVFVLAGLQ
jgi:endoglucanase